MTKTNSIEERFLADLEQWIGDNLEGFELVQELKRTTGRPVAAIMLTHSYRDPDNDRLLAYTEEQVAEHMEPFADTQFLIDLNVLMKECPSDDIPIVCHFENRFQHVLRLTTLAKVRTEVEAVADKGRNPPK